MKKSKEEHMIKVKEDNKKKKEEIMSKKMEEAEKQVEEKLKTTKRLTTDDLIMLQK